MKPIELLNDEYHTTLGFIDKCDDHIFKIKNWALITSSAVIAFSITNEKAWVPLLNVALLTAFIYLELIYKSFQDSAIEHTDDISKRIDRYFSEDNPLDLLSDFKHGFGRKLIYPSVVRVFSLLKNRKRWHILSFYVLLAVFSFCAILVSYLVA
jgi:hypothetical protein